MTKRRNGVIKYYPRTRVSHHLTNPLSHILAITVRCALRAECLLRHMRAGQSAAVGILGKGSALITQLLATVVFTAIQSYHIGNDTSLVA